MRAGRAAFDPADMEGGRGELDLLPLEVNKLSRPKAVPVGRQNHRRIALTPAVLAGGIEALNLTFSEMFAGSQGGIGRPLWHDCSVYDTRRDEFEVRFRHVFSPPSLSDCSDNARSFNSDQQKLAVVGESF